MSPFKIPLAARRLLVIAVSLLLLVALFPLFRIDIADFWNAALRLGPVCLVAVLSLSMVNYGLRYLRWHGFLQRLGVTLPHGRHILAYLSGFALTMTPGKAGEGLRARFLKSHGLGYMPCFGALFAERLLDLLVILTLSCLILTQGGQSWMLIVGGCAVAALLFGASHRSLPPAILRWADCHPRAAHLLRPLGELLAAASRLLDWKTLLPSLGIGLLAWAAEGWGLQLIANEIGVPIDMWSAIAIYSIAILAGALSMLPGGLGGTEGVMTFLLVQAGADAPSALAITLICRAATLWFSVLLGAASWLALECGVFPNHA